MSDNKIIQTQGGKVRGAKSLTALENKEYYAFKGIPFAEPPIGNLRFKAPQKAKPWDGVLDALEYKSKCAQMDFVTHLYEGSEDCLYVNVFVPAKAFTGEKLTTMLFIYGGAYQGGAAHTYGPDFLLNQDVIVVSFGYRVGPLGFLSLGTKEYSGNMGLKDQRLAIQWVHDNIEQFGGDKGKITLFGVSAGSSSAHFHVVIREEKKLFQRAILQSGVVLSNWSYNTRSDDKKALIQYAKENNDEITDFEKYLSNIDVKKLIKSAEKPLYAAESGTKIAHIFWAPTIERKDAVNPIFTEPIENLSNTDGYVNELDTFFGYTSMEMITFVAEDYVKEENLKAFDEKFRIRLPLQRTIPDFESKKYQEFADKVRTFYFGKNGTVNKASFVKYLDLMSDMWFAYGAQKGAQLQVKQSKGKAFLYRFSIESDMDFLKKMAVPVAGLPGASHGSDLSYLFLFAFMPHFTQFYKNIKIGSIEHERIKMMTKLWTNFAKYGEPDPTVKPIQGDIINFVDITNDGIVPGVAPNGDRVEFWDELARTFNNAV